MYFYPYFCQNPKIFSLINAIFSEFLNENFVMAKSKGIFIFTSLQDVTHMARFQRDSFWAFQCPVFDPAFRQCAQVLVDYFEV